MAYNLWEEAGKCSSLVAVLERTHLDGIRKYWSTSFLVSVVSVFLCYFLFYELENIQLILHLLFANVGGYGSIE